jgi:pimeloyl-ACP methyl ester carboxylesterase
MEGERRRIDRSYEAARERVSKIIRGTEPGWGYLQGCQNHISSPMNKKVYIFVNGILTRPEDTNGWTDNAEVWIERNTGCAATKFEYFAGAVSRRLWQNDRVNKLEDICKKYLGEKIILVGHSNGCDIIERLVTRGLLRFHELHLIAAASEADFIKNGYNKALKQDRVGKILVYHSPNDKALKKARLSTTLFGWMGLGYGYLGLIGPKKVDDEVADRVTSVCRRLDHSEWFVDHEVERTMRTIVHAEVPK